MSDQDYYASLPRKVVSAGALLFDREGRLLLLKPTYKHGWDIPGGVGEDGEGPWRTCLREVEEEIGLHRPPQRLLVVDYVPAHGLVPELLSFLFDGGGLTPEDLDRIRLPAAEIAGWQCVEPEAALALFPSRLARRVRFGLQIMRCDQSGSGAAIMEDGRSMDAAMFRRVPAEAAGP
jgi:8-oxo-dGTP pyrophosphatase MutT (NUDIX family)